MIIDVLVCEPDGTQRFEKQEVPDTFFNAEAKTATEDTEEN